MAHRLPTEIWNRIADWLHPFDQWSLSLTRKHAHSLLTDSQHANAKIWAQIIRSASWPKEASKEGIDLVLIEPESNSSTGKPYFLLVTTPRHEGPNWLHCGGLYKSIKGKTCEIVAGAALEKYFHDFTLNIDGVLNHGREICLPLEQLQNWTSGRARALYYSSSTVSTVEVKRYNAPHGYGQDIYIRLNDEEAVHLRCWEAPAL
ncbi:hypothetical protein B0J13DRAFT_579435, partial [Dactylonectria estremocensis]